MEFMVQIEVDLPAAIGPQERDRVRAAELARGRELVAAGAIRSIWRVPGGLRNVGIWKAEDAAELQALLESLPMYPWITAEVTALASHPLSEAEKL